MLKLEISTTTGNSNQNSIDNFSLFSKDENELTSPVIEKKFKECLLKEIQLEEE